MDAAAPAKGSARTGGDYHNPHPAGSPAGRGQNASVQALAAHQLGHFLGIGALDDAALGHDDIDQVGRRHVEYRIDGLDIRRDSRTAHF